MSAHLEFDFNDDGTITMTARPTKEVTVRHSQLKTPWQEVVVAAGLDNSITHRVIITDVANFVINGREWAS